MEQYCAELDREIRRGLEEIKRRMESDTTYAESDEDSETRPQRRVCDLSVSSCTKIFVRAFLLALKDVSGLTDLQNFAGQIRTGIQTSLNSKIGTVVTFIKDAVTPGVGPNAVLPTLFLQMDAIQGTRTILDDRRRERSDKKKNFTFSVPTMLTNESFTFGIFSDGVLLNYSTFYFEDNVLPFPVNFSINFVEDLAQQGNFAASNLASMWLLCLLLVSSV